MHYGYNYSKHSLRRGSTCVDLWRNTYFTGLIQIHLEINSGGFVGRRDCADCGRRAQICQYQPALKNIYRKGSPFYGTHYHRRSP